METDLVSPIPQIRFNPAHLVINYAPVESNSRSVRLWIPASMLFTLRIAVIATSVCIRSTISILSR